MAKHITLFLKLSSIYKNKFQLFDFEKRERGGKIIFLNGKYVIGSKLFFHPLNFLPIEITPGIRKRKMAEAEMHRSVLLK